MGWDETSTSRTGRPRWLVTWGYQVRQIGTDICHRGCAYTVLQTVKKACTVLHMVLCTIKNPWRSFEIRVGHSPGFGLPSVAILPLLCRKRRKAIFIYIYVSHMASEGWWDQIIITPPLVRLLSCSMSGCSRANIQHTVHLDTWRHPTNLTFSPSAAVLISSEV